MSTRAYMTAEESCTSLAGDEDDGGGGRRRWGNEGDLSFVFYSRCDLTVCLLVLGFRDVPLIGPPQGTLDEIVRHSAQSVAQQVLETKLLILGGQLSTNDIDVKYEKTGYTTELPRSKIGVGLEPHAVVSESKLDEDNREEERNEDDYQDRYAPSRFRL